MTTFDPTHPLFRAQIIATELITKSITNCAGDRALVVVPEKLAFELVLAFEGAGLLPSERPKPGPPQPSLPAAEPEEHAGAH